MSLPSKHSCKGSSYAEVKVISALYQGRLRLVRRRALIRCHYQLLRADPAQGTEDGAA